MDLYAPENLLAPVLPILTGRNGNLFLETIERANMRTTAMIGALLSSLPTFPDYGGGNAYGEIMSHSAKGISRDIKVKVQINRPRGWKKRQRKKQR